MHIDQVRKDLRKTSTCVVVYLRHEVKDDINWPLVSSSLTLVKSWVIGDGSIWEIDFLGVVENFYVRIVNLRQLFKHVIELSVVFNNKLSLDEARTFVEDVVPWLNIKLVSLLEGIVLLYFIFDYERHIAKR